MARGKALVFTNCREGQEAEFNRWYDDVHAAEVIEKTPITACTRLRLSDAQLEAAGGPPGHRYLAIYDFDGDAEAVRDALLTTKFEMSDALDPETGVMFFDTLEPS